MPQKLKLLPCPGYAESIPLSKSFKTSLEGGLVSPLSFLFSMILLGILCAARSDQCVALGILCAARSDQSEAGRIHCTPPTQL